MGRDRHGQRSTWAEVDGPRSTWAEIDEYPADKQMTSRRSANDNPANRSVSRKKIISRRVYMT